MRSARALLAVLVAVVLATLATSVEQRPSACDQCPRSWAHPDAPCCAAFAKCCGSVCCTAAQICDINVACIDPTPPKPSPKPWGPGSLEWSVYLGGALGAPVALDGGMVAVPTSSAVTVIEASTGILKYAAASGNAESTAPVSCASGLDLLFLYNGDTVEARDVTTGALRWTGQLDGPPSQQLIFVDTFVLAQGTSVFAFDAYTGSLVWHGGNPYTGYAQMPYAATRKVIGFATAAGVAGVDVATGAWLWNSSQVYPSSGQPVWTAGDKFIVNANSFGQGALYGVRAEDGVVAWNYSYSAMGAEPRQFGTTIYFVNTGVSKDPVAAIDAVTGAVLWTWMDPANDENGNPSVMGASLSGVAVFQDMGFTYGVTAGQLTWNRTAFIQSVPLCAAGDTLYLGTTSNQFAAVAASTGALVWSVATQDTCTQSPVLAGTVAVAACDDGFVYGVHA